MKMLAFVALLAGGVLASTPLLGSRAASAENNTRGGERTAVEIQRNVRECFDRLQNEPLAREICNVEQNLPGNVAAYEPKDTKTFAACLRALPRGRYAAQSRAICADNDATNRGHIAHGHLGHFEIKQ
jgi:hypothetical protein